MRDSKVINRFVCDTVLNSTKLKIGSKYIESDLARLLDLRFCNQNKTKLLLCIFMFCGFFLVYWRFVVWRITTCHTTKCQCYDNNPQNIKIHKSDLVLFCLQSLKSKRWARSDSIYFGPIFNLVLCHTQNDL